MSTAYLKIYNAVQVLGWSYVGFLTVKSYLAGSFEPVKLWDNVELPLKIFQSLAILEVVHAALGLVSSKVGITLAQVFSRVFVLWMALHSCDASKSSVGLHLILFAWTITEIIRYAFYFFALSGGVPYLLKYLRYTLFIVLYPIGITGELILCYNALQEFSSTGKFSYDMPNKLNAVWKTSWLTALFMLSYIPVFPQLYLHMFGQRKKTLSPAAVHKKLE